MKGQPSDIRQRCHSPLRHLLKWRKSKWWLQLYRSPPHLPFPLLWKVIKVCFKWPTGLESSCQLWHSFFVWYFSPMAPAFVFSWWLRPPILFFFESIRYGDDWSPYICCSTSRHDHERQFLGEFSPTKFPLVCSPSHQPIGKVTHSDVYLLQ